MIYEHGIHTSNNMCIDGTCFICNDCGDDNTENEQCSGPSQSNGASSTCIETTAYTLLALIDNEDTDNIICLSSWLAKQKNKFSVFSSSQVKQHVLKFHQFLVDSLNRCM